MSTSISLAGHGGPKKPNNPENAKSCDELNIEPSWPALRVIWLCIIVGALGLVLDAPLHLPALLHDLYSMAIALGTGMIIMTRAKVWVPVRRAKAPTNPSQD